MNANCTVAIKNQDATISGIYNNFDGHVKNGVGEELVKNYTTESKIKDLIDLGACSYIVNDVIAYHRDRDEEWEDVKPKTYSSYKIFIDEMGQEFNYLFDDGTWYIYEPYPVDDDIENMRTIEEVL